ncbi:exodeoxyribonuclease III [Candidatus Nitrospira neomarina]|uniref:Exodeoxyribonuclease III n=1 Tax=Candidatus Nitrospira neomarina TaxID=3020899 RepID=A0AA96GEZ2_9BACT|nr:exodeoxyribonuclease III [Candidatus Nitrospira neomarina]WNM60984.1 exodeoxyribonuclease III [Candidatus Nitrospira neomarina]
MKIATWNVNSIKVRIPHLMEWVKQANPDIVLLQELKTTEDQFPRMAIEELGYNMAIVGQKTYNGVAILSKAPIEIEHTALPGAPSDEQARYVEAVVGNVRVASIYLPNGNPLGTEKFSYKLAWLDRLITHAQLLLALEEAVVLGGDFNVCPTDHDVYNPMGFADDALCRPESRARFRALCHLGYTDALRALHPELGLYTYWDYQAGRWNRDEGLRIDHLLLSPQAADRLVAADVDRGPRGMDKPSDHTPVWCELS